MQFLFLRKMCLKFENCFSVTMDLYWLLWLSNDVSSHMGCFVTSLECAFIRVVSSTLQRRLN